jgi:hypothetical protein
MGNITTYEHHGATVFVDEGLRGSHRGHCLCWRCASFHPGQASNCPIAQELYGICVRHNLVTPVYECPVFRAKGGLEESEIGGELRGMPVVDEGLERGRDARA